MEIFNINIILVFAYYLIFQILFPNRLLAKKLFLICVWIQLILLFALRSDTTGIDILRYQSTYDWIANHDINAALTVRGEFENIGYFLTNYFLSRIGISFYEFLAIVGILAVSPILLIIYRYSRFPLISVIIYLSLGIYAFQFSGLKQTIAMSLVLIAFHYLILGLKYKFFSLLFIAILFHPTAIVVLPMYFIVRTNRVKLLIALLIFVAFVTFLLRNKLGLLAVSIYDSSYIGTYESSGSVGGTSVFIFIIILLFMILSYDRIFDFRRIESIYFRLLLVCFTLQIMSSYAYVFTRINFYYIQFLSLIIPELLLQFKLYIKNKYLANICIYIMWISIVIVCLFQYHKTFLVSDSEVQYEFNSLYF